MPRRPLVLALFAVAALPARAAAFPLIGVSVRESDGVERHRWPLAISAPFRRGAARPGETLRVVDERGAALPAQTKALATWPDGSLRWLLLDTQVDLKPHRARRLRIVPGRAPAPVAPARVSTTDDVFVVDTGAIRFTVPRTRFAILEALQPRGSGAPLTGGLSAVLVAAEHTHDAQPPGRSIVTATGPLRVRIELQGTYGDGFDYVIRLEAYAGQPFVRVWHTLIDRNPAPYVSIARLAVELPLAEPAPSRWSYGVVGRPAVNGDLPAAGVRLYQSDDESYAVGDAARAGRLAGWLELEGGGAPIGLAARWLWEQYPQSIAARPDRLVYNLWAPEAEPAKAGVGAAKTHEFVVWAAPPRALPAGAAAGMARPLLGVVDPNWVAQSGALPQAVAPQAASGRFVHKALEAARRYAQRNAVERWDDCGAVRCEAPGLDRRRTGAYGMWNWGDWNFRGFRDTTKGTDSWGNLEYDTAYVLALTYAASGDEEVHDMMVAAARHFIDVDTIHACPARPAWVGMNHPKNPLHFSFELGGPDLGHTWTQGSIAYYYLTGDERGLQAARGVADYLVDRVDSMLRGNPRQWGWPQIALLAVYDATGERRYLDAALAYARGGMHAHPPTGSTQWKLGILADALAYAHAASGDPEIGAWLEQYARAVIQRKAHADARALPAVAYVAAWRGDKAMRETAREQAERLDLGNWGKPYSINGRIGFRIESLLAAPPPAAPLAKPPRRQTRH
jgi:hypothetical protein